VLMMGVRDERGGYVGGCVSASSPPCPSPSRLCVCLFMGVLMMGERGGIFVGFRVDLFMRVGVGGCVCVTSNGRTDGRGIVTFTWLDVARLGVA
jgi:hypothetical protein